jgi:hypothetical protein
VGSLRGGGVYHWAICSRWTRRRKENHENCYISYRTYP